MLKLTCKTNKEDGFSLVEMLVVTVVFLAVIAISLQLIKLANFDVRTSKNINESYMNGRSAMKFLERDIANAGNQVLQGAGATGGATGPVVSRDAFTSITSINVPAGRNRQELFCIVPVNKEDSLGNGANRFGRADRITISYSDEFFDGGTQDVRNAGGTSIRTRRVNTFAGTFNNANQTLRIQDTNIPDPDTANAGGRVITDYRVDNVRAGDIFQISINANETPVLLMVTGVNTSNETITFGTNDVLGFNRKSPPGTYTPGGKAIDQEAFPMDVFDTLNPLGALPVVATKVSLYSYQVNPTTRELVRRRYTVAASDTPMGFLDDPVCQGVERFWLSYNLFIDGDTTVTPPIPPTFSQDTELDPKADITQLDRLQFISRVNAKLIVRSQEIDRRNGRPSRLALEGAFTPRNIAYAGNQERK